MRNSAYVMSAFLVFAPQAWADVNVSRGEQLGAAIGDEAGNFVDLFLQDFATRSGTSNYYILITGFGPDLGEFTCTGATVFGSPITDPVNITGSAKHGTAAFMTAGLTDDQGEPCRTDVQVVVDCSAGDDVFRDVCSSRSTTYGNSTRIKFNSWSVSADCTVQVQVGDFMLQGRGEGNGSLAVSHSLSTSE